MSRRRYELTDFEWSIIGPLLPNKPRGVPRADDRKVLNGIFWRAMGEWGMENANVAYRRHCPLSIALRNRVHPRMTAGTLRENSR